MTVLLSLPTELLCHCLDFLDYQSLSNCRSVCHELKSTIDADTHCQYALALAGAGLGDVSSSDPRWSTAEKLDAVHRYERAWRKLEYSSHRTYPSASGGLWELYNGIWGHDTEDGNVFEFIQLPSEIRGIHERQWRIKLDVAPRDFTFEPSHDLLVLIVPHNPDWDSDDDDDDGEPGLVFVHLRTLSDGLRHPHAKIAEFEFPSDRNALPAWSYSIRVCGRYLGVLRSIGREETELTVWNWIEGTQVLTLSGNNTLKGFMFLDEDAIIVASLVSPNSPPNANYTNSSLIVYSLSNPSSQSDSNMDADAPSGSVYDTPFLVTLQLPRIPRRNESRVLQIHSDPSPYVSGGSEPDVPFRLDSRERMLLVNTLFLWEEQPTTRTAVIPFSYIRKWSVWVCFVYGMRYVHPHLLRDEDGMLYVGMADFLKTRRRFGALQEGKEGMGQGMQPVKLVLPAVLQREGNRFMAVMISEDSIVILSRELEDRQLHVLSF